MLFRSVCKLLVRLIFKFLGSDSGEITELINTAAFIIIGGGFGMAVNKSKAGSVGFIFIILLLVLILPTLYIFNSIIDYHLWIQTISEKQKISYDQSQIIINDFLRKETSFSGFFGYYNYLAKAFMFGDKVTENYVLAIIVNWGIRIFYFGLSIFFTVFSYKETANE